MLEYLSIPASVDTARKRGSDVIYTKCFLMIYKFLVFIVFGISCGWMFFSPNWEPLIAIITSIALYFKNEVFGFVGKGYISLTPKSWVIKDLSESKFSFIKSEFIHPKIIEDLSGLISDLGDQTISINLENSNNSNKYFGEVKIKNEHKYPIVTCDGENNSYFAYQYIGSSYNGIHIIRTWDCGGGSSVFCNIMFLILTTDYSMTFEEEKLVKYKRSILKKIGALPLGDYYNGRISYKWGCLIVSSDKGLNEQIMKRRKVLFVF